VALGVGVLVAGLAVGGWFLAHSRLLSARVVTVSGSSHTPDAEVLAAAGLGAQPPLLDVDPAAVAGRVERLPWVASATVARHWPDGVSISVVERAPVAVVASGGAWSEVDGTGRVLTTVAAPPAGLVKLAAPVSPGDPGTMLAPVARPGLAVAASLPPASVVSISY